jgi:hypothetical protein
MAVMQGVPLARLAPLSVVAASYLTLVAVATGCGGSEDSGVTYQKDISTLFSDCTLCHRPGAPVGPGTRNGPDVLNPFSPDDGLSVAPSYWKVDNPSYNLPIPERDVTPGDPDQSFLLLKLSNPELGLLPEHTGNHMPDPIQPITPDQLQAIEQWVTDGAQDNDFYHSQVEGIFAANIYTSKCVLCHYHGTPNPPDLTDPFGPDGVVGVPSLFRSDLLRVAPGDPDASLLVQRVRQSAGDNLPTPEFGAPMPKPTRALDDAQQALVREWIAQGARP